MFSLIYSPGNGTQVEAATSTSVEAPVAPQPEMNTEGLIGDLALILVFGAVFTLLFKKLKQPVVLGYIVAGFFVGPHFLYCPSVTNEANIDFWAQIGIIVLLFSLGLEFNFKKLLNVGGSAAITAVMIVAEMIALGSFVGKLMGFSSINSLFLGAMLSMSSTTIIIKALGDLNMRQRKFVPLVYGVLICEDLLAVVLMVLLSSIAINNTVTGTDMLYSVLKLLFFLIIWFTIGVYLLPSFFKYFRKYINSELLLITAMGLCFLMAVFSVSSGFSLALGAFVMGSILAGTCEAEHIEKVVNPVKDLFGGVFFISVGMMVDPAVIVEYIGPIAILSLVVVVGQIVFGTVGMLITGQTLRIAMESGFSLTQIGEFSFIIASLGMSLGVLEPNIYPIIVAVSVVTTFFTPYIIKAAIPAYNRVEKLLPERLRFLIERYSDQAAEESETLHIWKAIARKYIWRIVLYSALLTGIITVSLIYVLPFMERYLGKFGDIATATISLIAMAPFLLALSSPVVTKSQRKTLGNKSLVPLVALTVLKILLALAFVIVFLSQIYSVTIGAVVGMSILVLIIVFASKNVKKRLSSLEENFVNNLNVRELRRSGKNNNIISDLHVAYMTVGYTCPFVGERLRDSNLRKEYGVNIASIQRGSETIPIPTGDVRIFPGDLLGIIGTDEQIAHLLPIVEGENPHNHPKEEPIEVKFEPIEVVAGSFLDGKTTATSRLRDDYSSLLVALQRGTEYIKPNGTEKFVPGDILWVVGDTKKITLLRTK